MVFIKPNHPFGNKSNRNADLFSPTIHSEFFYDRSILQTTINPYELISSTLHNNEFSPTSSMYDVMRQNEQPANDLRGKIKVNESCRYNILDVRFPNGSGDIETSKSKSSCSQAPPPPALESLPLLVKSVPDKIPGNSNTKKVFETELRVDNSNIMKSSLDVRSKTPGSARTVNMMRNGLKKIIKESKSVRADDVTTLTGSSKRVQFNTLPELPRSRKNKGRIILDGFAKQNNSNFLNDGSEFEEEVHASSDTVQMNIGTCKTLNIFSYTVSRCKLVQFILLKPYFWFNRLSKKKTSNAINERSC